MNSSGVEGRDEAGEAWGAWEFCRDNSGAVWLTAPEVEDSTEAQPAPFHGPSVEDFQVWGGDFLGFDSSFHLQMQQIVSMINHV